MDLTIIVVAFILYRLRTVLIKTIWSSHQTFTLPPSFQLLRGPRTQGDNPRTYPHLSNGSPFRSRIIEY
jgi:hypothetical protein